ncbi:hypothetical protein [Megalodesulfovibrio gigas]|uniref:hypothetical protein n=1 Tax=Megalodesulfovibrio gigas TaxID=879 RepID=UPI00042841BA|nr:hypothetical protein [Megalodesulfovibrio gigas]
MPSSITLAPELTPQEHVALSSAVMAMDKQLASLAAWAKRTRELLDSPACANALGAREGGELDATRAVYFTAPLDDVAWLLERVRDNLEVEMSWTGDELYHDLSLTWEQLEEEEPEGAGAAAPTLDPARAIGTGMTLGQTPGLTPGLEAQEAREAAA